MGPWSQTIANLAFLEWLVKGNQDWICIKAESKRTQSDRMESFVLAFGVFFYFFVKSGKE